MAPMDGLALLRAVRDDPATAEVPFIFVSARSPDADRRRPAAACEVDAVVSKGIVEQQLPGTVHAALAGGRRAPAAPRAGGRGFGARALDDARPPAWPPASRCWRRRTARRRSRASAPRSPTSSCWTATCRAWTAWPCSTRCRSDEATAAIPVVFVTGRATAREVAEGLGRGAHDYVRKPVEEAELVARVRSALRTRRLRDELRERNLQLERMARIDVLTGMLGRRHGATVLAEACAAAAGHRRAARRASWPTSTTSSTSTTTTATPRATPCCAPSPTSCATAS